MSTKTVVAPSGIQTDPPGGVTLTNLAPGDTYSTTLSVMNTSAFPVEIGTLITKEGALFQGANPLQVSFSIVPGGGEPCPAHVGALPADSRVEVQVDVVFPIDAGNKYQLQSGSAMLFITATEITQEQCIGELPSGPGSSGPDDAGGPGTGVQTGAVPGTGTGTQTGAVPGSGIPGTGLDVSVAMLLALGFALFGCLVRSLPQRWKRRAA